MDGRQCWSFQSFQSEGDVERGGGGARLLPESGRGTDSGPPHPSGTRSLVLLIIVVGSRASTLDSVDAISLSTPLITKPRVALALGDYYPCAIVAGDHKDLSGRVVCSVPFAGSSLVRDGVSTDPPLPHHLPPS